MKRIGVWLVLLLVGFCAGRLRAAEPELDDLNRQVQAAEDLRFRRTVELAAMLSKVDRLQEARRLYEEALTLRPDDADVMDALLQVLRRLGDFEAQLPLCRRLIAVRPGDVQLHLRSGECLWRLNRTQEARATWDDLLKRFPSERLVYDELIDFYLAEGRTEDAGGMVRACRGRFGEDAEVLEREVRLTVAQKKPADALPVLFRLLDLDLSDTDNRRTEFLLFRIARETGRTPEVLRMLAARVDTVDAQLAGRLMTLADKAAEAQDFAQAVDLGERALPLLKDPAKQAELSARVTLWRAKPLR